MGVSKEVTIYGKTGCPFTNRAKTAFAEKGYEINYIDVKTGSPNLNRMLKLTDGKRRVPVIVEDGQVSIGFKGS